MKAVLAFFVFLIILISASAVIDVQITGKKVPSSITNVHSYQQKDMYTIDEGKPQGFTSPLRLNHTRGAITFKQDGGKAPKTGEWYFFNTTTTPGSVQTYSTPTGGAVVYKTEKTSITGIIVALVILLSIASLFFILKGTTNTQTKVIFVAATLIIMAFATMKVSQPTGYAIQEYPIEEYQVQPETITPSGNSIVNAFTLTWTNGGPVTFLPQGPYQCSDGINNDFEDSLIDCADPGCHTDGNASNPNSCDPNDDLEMNMLEYDHPPVVDNQIDVYDIVSWIQYYNGDTTVLTHCTSLTCTNQIGTANCVGNVDPNKDTLVNAVDMTYLQSAELNNADSRTIPAPGINQSICFNPI